MRSATSRALRALPTLLRVGVAETVAYRAEFLVWMLTSTMPLVMLALMSSIAREAPFKGYTEAGFVTYYLSVLIVRQLTGNWVAWQLAEEIRNGTLAMRLLRPIHPFIAFASSHAAAIPFRSVIALPIAIILLVTTGAPGLANPLQLALVVPSIAIAWVLTFAILFAIGSLVVLDHAVDGGRKSIFRAVHGAVRLSDQDRHDGPVREGHLVVAVSLHAQCAGRADHRSADRPADPRDHRRPGRVDDGGRHDRAVGVARRRPPLRGGGRMIRRYWRVVAIQLRISAASAMAYRANFLLEGFMTLAWMFQTMLPLFVVFSSRDTVAGWDIPSTLIIIAYFTAVHAVLEGIISPSLVDLVERIRSGSFDYVLLKPIDAQAMMSSSRQEPWKVLDLLAALAIVVYAFIRRGYPPAAIDVALGIVMFFAGVAAMYGLFVMCAAASFWVVRLDNLTYLLEAVFDTARWPIQVFRGAWRFVFTFVVPLALMTTFPAMALLGRLEAPTALATVAGALAILAVSRLLWVAAIRSYTSASS